MKILDEMHLVKGIDPVADAFSGTVTSDVVECWGGGVLFVVYKGVGATGTSTCTCSRACARASMIGVVPTAKRLSPKRA